MINRQTAKMLLKLFETCFKQGVIDACEQDDDYWCREFIEARRTQGDFSLLDVRDSYDWKEWRMIIGRWCRYTHNLKLCVLYLDKVYTKNFYWSVFPIAMDFYMLGIEEYLEYPNPINLELFKTKSGQHWKPMKTKIMQHMDRDEKVGYVQQFAFERERMDPEANGKYTAFAQEVWGFTRPLPPDPLKELKKKKKNVRKSI